MRLSRLVFMVVICVPVFFLKAQDLVTKDSFFPPHIRLPRDFKNQITESSWIYMGTYRSDNGKIVLPDSPQPALIVFEKGESYRRIKGKKIISNDRDDTQKIVHLDETILILEAKDKKGRYRSLYRKRKAGKVSTAVIKKSL